MAAGVLLVGLSIAWAAGVFEITTKDGVIVLEKVPENAVVEVDGERVTVTPVRGEPVKIETRPGTHRVVVNVGGKVLLAENLTLESAKASRLTITRAPEVPAQDAVLTLENVPANAVVEVDGEKTTVGGAGGEPVKVPIKGGRHLVVVKRGNDVLLGKSVTLVSGKPLTLTVPKDAVLVLEKVPANAVVEIDGARVPVPPSGGESVKIELRPGTHGVHVKQGDEVLLADSVTLEAGGQFTRSVLVKVPPETQPSAPKLPAAPATAEKRPAEWTSPSTKMSFVRIEQGEFLMGSPDGDKDANEDEHPQHKVRISPFFLGVTEVTQAEYVAVMGNNPSGFSSDRRPVENVSWLAAIKFCNSLSRNDGLNVYYDISGANVGVPNPKGPGYRLPTEAAWEYACRAGNSQRYSFGDEPSKLGDYAWYEGNLGGTTHPVGQKLHNAFGLYDMHGNVYEWCWDWYDKAYYKRSPEDDPRGASGFSLRVFRGGSWSGQPRGCRSANRRGGTPRDRYRELGFRVALGQSDR